MIESVIALLQTGLGLWASKEKTKYIDKLLSLKRDYYEEINRPYEERDNAKLDSITFELRILGDSFVASASKQDIGNKS